MISIDGSVVVQIGNFVLLIFILNYILYKPIRKILKERKEKFTGLQQGIEMHQKEVRTIEESFSSGIRAARAKGLKEKEAIVAEASEEERKIIEEITRKAQADFEQIRAKIEADSDDVRNSLQQEINAFASAIGEKILGRTV